MNFLGIVIVSALTPIAIEYFQQLLGSRELHRLEKQIEYAKNLVAIKEYCTRISQIQQEVQKLFMALFLSKLERDLELKNKYRNDTLLCIAKIKLEHNNITEYDFKQIELQSLNIQYAYENSIKNYQQTQQQLIKC